MSQLINSGIIYLEQFVDDTNLLPADLTRSLDYIRTLDERILGACIASQRSAAALWPLQPGGSVCACC